MTLRNAFEDLATEATLEAVRLLLAAQSTQLRGRAEWGRTEGAVPGTTREVATLVADVDMVLSGFVATGTADGFFRLRLNGDTVLSGQINRNAPTLDLSLTHALDLSAGDTVDVQVEVTAEVTSDYEATIHGGQLP